MTPEFEIGDLVEFVYENKLCEYKTGIGVVIKIHKFPSCYWFAIFSNDLKVRIAPETKCHKLA